MKEWREEKIGKGLLFSICIILAVFYFIPFKVDVASFHYRHANVFHLIMNMIALTTVMYRCKTYMLSLAFFFTSMVWLTTTGVVGFSGVIFFMWGTRFPYDIHNSQEPHKYIGMVSIPLLLSALIPQLSFKLHFFPFVIGAIFGLADYLYTRYQMDINRTA